MISDFDSVIYALYIHYKYITVISPISEHIPNAGTYREVEEKVHTLKCCNQFSGFSVNEFPNRIEMSIHGKCNIIPLKVLSVLSTNTLCAISTCYLPRQQNKKRIYKMYLRARHNLYVYLSLIWILPHLEFKIQSVKLHNGK